MAVREHGTSAKYTREKCRCEPCVQAYSDYQKHWRSQNRDREDRYNANKRARRDATQESIRRRELLYQLSDKDFQNLLNRQNHACAICLTPFDERQAHVDHNHSCCSGPRSCGKCIRGLLCHFCNTAIGKLNDDPVLVQRALAYLTAAEVTTLSTYYSGG